MKIGTEMQSSAYSTPKEIASNILIVPGEFHKGASTRKQRNTGKKKRNQKPKNAARQCCPCVCAAHSVQLGQKKEGNISKSVHPTIAGHIIEHLKSSSYSPNRRCSY